MSSQNRFLRFFWWNLGRFAHFDDSRNAETDWPSTNEEYEARVQRISSIIERRFSPDPPPELMAFGETTERAALALRDRLAPSHKVLSMDDLPRKDFQVAFVYAGAMP